MWDADTRQKGLIIKRQYIAEARGKDNPDRVSRILIYDCNYINLIILTGEWQIVYT